MRRYLNSICILMICSALVFSQSAPAKPAAKPAEKASEKSDSSVYLPSEETVDSFLHQSLGYQPDVTWKISSIRPAGIGGLAEVTVILANPQGPQQLSRFYVTADGAHAVTGDIIPFGARPFDAARKFPADTRKRVAEITMQHPTYPL